MRLSRWFNTGTGSEGEVLINVCVSHVSSPGEAGDGGGGAGRQRGVEVTRPESQHTASSMKEGMKRDGSPKFESSPI